MFRCHLRFLHPRLNVATELRARALQDLIHEILTKPSTSPCFSDARLVQQHCLAKSHADGVRLDRTCYVRLNLREEHYHSILLLEKFGIEEENLIGREILLF